MNFDEELDVRGLVCPLPILRTKKQLADMKSGKILKIVATDPGTVIDFQVFSEQTGHQLLNAGAGEMVGEFLFFLRKR
ncbi:MAG: sulfurtransferase TusA family protein [Nitrosomonas sp.]|nr:sulfurtransferase TusA family protein [Nitrosomonas sp.]